MWMSTKILKKTIRNFLKRSDWARLYIVRAYGTFEENFIDALAKSIQRKERLCQKQKMNPHKSSSK